MKNLLVVKKAEELKLSPFITENFLTECGFQLRHNNRKNYYLKCFPLDKNKSLTISINIFKGFRFNPSNNIRILYKKEFESIPLEINTLIYKLNELELDKILNIFENLIKTKIFYCDENILNFGEYAPAKKIIISKNEFVRIMKNLDLEQNKKSLVYSDMIYLLKNIFNDSNLNVINWWLDSSLDNRYVTLKNKIDLSDPSDLYDYLSKV